MLASEPRINLNSQNIGFLYIKCIYYVYTTITIWGIQGFTHFLMSYNDVMEIATCSV